MTTIQIQQKLIALGLLQPPNDGGLDSMTEAALRQALREFQYLSSLPSSGELTEETISKLNSCETLVFERRYVASVDLDGTVNPRAMSYVTNSPGSVQF